AIADLVNGLQGGQAPQDAARLLGLEGALLNQIEQAGGKTEEERGIADKDKCDVEEDPAAAHERGGEQDLLLAHGRGEGEEEHQGKNHNPRCAGAVAGVNDHKEQNDDEGQERLGIVQRGQGELALKEGGLGERDKVEDHAESNRGQREASQQVA